MSRWGGVAVAKTRVYVYEDLRGWRYYWREGDPYAYMLRAPASVNLVEECLRLEEAGVAPGGSVGCRWTPGLFDEDGVRLLAICEKGRFRKMS